jgi:hypothetical protein
MFVKFFKNAYKNLWEKKWSIILEYNKFDNKGSLTYYNIV